MPAMRLAETRKVESRRTKAWVAPIWSQVKVAIIALMCALMSMLIESHRDWKIQSGRLLAKASGDCMIQS